MNLLASHADFIKTQPSVWKKYSEQAAADFLKTGLPNRSHEDWRYFSLKALEKENFQPLGKSSNKALPNLPQQFNNIVFKNGKLAIPAEKDNAVHVEPLTVEAFNRFEDLKKQVQAKDNPLEKLNLAYLNDGIVLTVKKDNRPQKPIQLLFFNDENNAAIYPRIYVIVEPGAKLELIETYVGASQNKHFVNSVVEILVGNSAKLEYVRTQNDSDQAINIGRTRIYVQESAAVQSLAVSVGAQLARHDLDVFLNQPGAHSEVNGVYLTAGAQVTDNHTNIDFVARDCSSTQLYKGILKDQSRAVFNGRVCIRHNSQKSSSEQLNNNLLLSSQAEVDSKPQLEILADDVKATHGSTVGQLSAEEIFYCQSRAIPKEKAVQMLSAGFVLEIIEKVSSESIRNWLKTLLEEKWN